jgi:group I intron endonuclease
VDLTKRLRQYYSAGYLKNELLINKSIIYKALVKYGYSGFQLEILEYCEPRDRIKREQYYLDLLAPVYNILKIAGSHFDFKHSEESLAKMSEAKKGLKNPFYGKNHTEETKAKMRNKKYSEETKAKMSEANGIAIKVICKETNLTSTFSSITNAAEWLGVTSQALLYHFKKSSSFLFKGRYLIEKQ